MNTVENHTEEPVIEATANEAKAGAKVPVPKRAKAKKAARETKSKAKAEAPADAQQTVATLADLLIAYPAQLEAIGKSAATRASYASDLKIAIRHFGEKTKLAAITKRRLLDYYRSDLVTLGRSGEPKNAITVAKIRRVLRLALVWAAEAGHIAPPIFPAKAEIEA